MSLTGAAAAPARAAWRLTLVLGLLGLALGWATHVSAAPSPLSIAAASDLQVVLPRIVKQFEAESGQSVRLTFGSSGTFFAQISNGAPFDLFLSADIDYPRTLVARGKADRESLYSYALGQLVLWSRNGSGVDLQRGLSALSDPAVGRIAIANPGHAPYGRAAMAAFERAGITGQVKSRLVLGENVAQAAQFAQSGNASVGLVPLALALSPALSSQGRYVAVPASMFPPIIQAAVVVSASANRTVAGEFIAFLKRPAVIAQLSQAGFLAP